MRQKATALALLWLTIGYTAAFVVSPLWGKILLVAIAAAVSVHLTMIPTCPPPKAGDPPPLSRAHRR